MQKFVDLILIVEQRGCARKRLREIGVVIESSNNYRGGKNCRYSFTTFRRPARWLG